MANYTAFSQDIWTLETCLDSALNNNTEISQALLNAEVAKINATQAKNDFTPSLNGYATHGFYFGRNLDPVSNDFTQTQRQNTGFTVNGNWLLFSGMSRYYTVKKSRLEIENFALSTSIARRNIKLSVLTFYLQALLSQELIWLSQEHLNYTLNEEKRITEMIRLELKTKVDLIEISSQKAREELLLTQAENQNNLALLQLRRVMQLSSSTDFAIDTALNTIYLDTSLFKEVNQFPEIQKTDILLEQAMMDVKRTKADYFPSLSMSAGIGSGYSDGYYLLDPITGDAYLPTFPDQFRQNIYQNIVFSVSIPIYNQNRTRSSAQLQTIEAENLKLEKEILIRELTGTVDQLKMDIINAKAELRAAAELLNFAELDFEQSQVRFEKGTINYSDLLVKKERLFESQSNLVQSKYNYYFKQKILTLYYE